MQQTSSQLSGQLQTFPSQQTSKEKQPVTQDQSDEEEKSAEQLIAHPKFGKMKLIHDGQIHISLGPDYICFIPAWLCFLVVTYLIVRLVDSTSDSPIFRIITYIICIGHCLSYLLVAISDPGVVTKSQDNLLESERRMCIKCSMLVPRHARHCQDCNVCIQYYDHHCPWTSKCIGGNNLVRFYVFLGWTPIFLIYVTVAFVVCMSSSLINIQQLPKKI